jgi:glycosyltransferase involved in cell wall biosynthesis
VTNVLPLVSIVIPYYNHGRHLHSAIHSALRSYAGPKEIIIVNDGSIEHKASIFLENAKAIDKHVLVIEKPNGGLSSARNAALSRAQGEFVQFLDSDDLLVPGKIDLQISHFEIQPSLDVSISNYLLCDEEAVLFSRDGDPISRFRLNLSDFLRYWERGLSIPIHCGLFRRAALGGIEFDTTVAGKEDWIFWCRQAHAGSRFGYLPVYGAVYRQHAEGMSKSFRAMGNNWLIAAKRIQDFVSPEDGQFERLAQSWHREFYLPRIAQEEGVGAGPPPQPRNNSSSPMLTSDDMAAVDEDSWPENDSASCHVRVEAPLFSIVIPVNNHYTYLRTCLQSAVSQAPPGGVETIVVDDFSTDDRVRPLLKQFSAVSPNITLLFNDRNQGISFTQNAAAKIARGKYLAFLDCDDWLEADALSAVGRKLSSDVDYLFTDRTDVDAKSNKLRVSRYGGYSWLQFSNNIKGDLLDAMVASHLKVIKRDTYEKVGGSDKRYAGVQDWELALKIADTGGKFVYLSQPLYNHRLHGGSVTSSDAIRQFWLSNLVRRSYARRWVNRKISDQDSLAHAARICALMMNGASVDPREFVLITDFELPGTFKIVKEAWRQGKVSIYRPGLGKSVQQLNLVREYNSYFDAVLADDERTACFFLGYMWDHTALRFAGETSRPTVDPAQQSGPSMANVRSGLV